MKDSPIPQFTYGYYTDTREECVRKFGSIFQLHVGSAAFEEAKAYYAGGRILDVGAGKDKLLKRALQAKDENYFTVDTDPEGTFEYQTVSDIPADAKFEMMVANQLFEHLEIQESIDMIVSLAKHLSDGGYFLASIPNVMHPNRYRGDITHRTFWDYKALYTLFRYAGLDVVKIARYSKREPKGFVERWLAKKMQDIYRIDWADSILVIGQKHD